jgi:hypothetical protein
LIGLSLARRRAVSYPSSVSRSPARCPSVDSRDSKPHAGRIVLTRQGDRRQQRAEDLFRALTARHISFWPDVHTLFVQHDITRHDLRGLVRRALESVGGDYRKAVRLLGMPEMDMERFVAFLDSYDCLVELPDSANGDSRPLSRRREGVA